MNSARTDRTRRRGYTLLELTIVVFVMAALTGMALQSYANHLERAKAARCQEDLRILTDAARRYQAFEGEPARAVSELRGKYLANREAIQDPWGRPYRIDEQGPYSLGPYYIEMSPEMVTDLYKRHRALAAKLPAAIAAEPLMKTDGDRLVSLEGLVHYPNPSELLDPWGNYLLFDRLSCEVLLGSSHGPTIRLGGTDVYLAIAGVRP